MGIFALGKVRTNLLFVQLLLKLVVEYKDVINKVLPHYMIIVIHSAKLAFYREI